MAQTVQYLDPAIHFLDQELEDQQAYTFAIMVARYRDSWIWVRHRDRSTWELPAGHLQAGESADQAARRELFEETGALVFDIHPIVSYQGILTGKTVYGKIYLAHIQQLGPLPDYEITEIRQFGSMPENLTYPATQQLFFNYVLNRAGQFIPSSR